ncbi:hypothetical protein ACFLZM_06760 [Thermodesulfobacteriota bacterium]
MPVLDPDDANRDCRIDLKDAIIWVGYFIQSAENPTAFPETVKNAVSALRIAAGLTASIRADNHPESNVTSISIKLPYLLTGIADFFPPVLWIDAPEQSRAYRSIDRIIDSPPPRNCWT